MKIKFQWIIGVILFSSYGLYQGAPYNPSTEIKNKNISNNNFVNNFEKILEKLNKKNNNGDDGDDGLDFTKNLLGANSDKKEKTKEKTNIEILLKKIKQDKSKKIKINYDVFNKENEGLKHIKGLVNFYNTTENFPQVHQQAIKLIEKSLELLKLKVEKDNKKEDEDIGIDFSGDRYNLLDLKNNGKKYSVVWEWNGESGIDPTPLTIEANNISHCLILINGEPQWMKQISDLQQDLKKSINDTKNQDLISIVNQKPEEFLGTIVEIINGNGIDCAGVKQTYKKFTWDQIIETVRKSFENTIQYVNKKAQWPTEFQIEYNKLRTDLKKNNKTIDKYQSTIKDLIFEAKKQNNNYLKITMEITRWYITDKAVRQEGGIEYLKDFDENFLTYDVENITDYLFNSSQWDLNNGNYRILMGGIKDISPEKVEESFKKLQDPDKALDALNLVNAIEKLHVILKDENFKNHRDQYDLENFKIIKEGVDFVSTEIARLLKNYESNEKEKKNFKWSDFYNKFIVNNQDLFLSLAAIDVVFSLEQNKKSFAKLQALSDDQIFKLDPSIEFANNEIEQNIKDNSPWAKPKLASGSASGGASASNKTVAAAATGAAAAGTYYQLINNRREYIKQENKKIGVMNILATKEGRQQIANVSKDTAAKIVQDAKYLTERGVDGIVSAKNATVNFGQKLSQEVKPKSWWKVLTNS